MKDVILSLLRKTQNILEYPILLQAKVNKIQHSFVKNLVNIHRIVGNEIFTILDVGAATGEFTKAARLVYPNAHIYSFEPIPESFQKLKQAVGGDSKTKIFNYALGSENNKSTFHLNEFSFSSSFLKMTNIHKKIFPFTRNEKEVVVDVRRLDSIHEVEIKRPSVIKMDVQGFEMEVLKGAGKLIDLFDIIQLEVNFESFYEGQASYVEIFNFMYDKNYKKFWQEDLLYSGKTNLMACDLIFMK